MQRLSITGAVNGTNDTFVLSPAPVVLRWFRNGSIQNPGGDYILVGSATVKALPGSIPQSGDVLQALSNPF